MAWHGSGWVGSLISQLCHIPGQWHQGKNVLGRESIDGESWLISWLTVWWSDVLMIWWSDVLMVWGQRSESQSRVWHILHFWHLDSKCKQGLNCIWKQTWQLSIHHCHIPEDIGKGRVFPTRFSLYSSSREASSHSEEEEWRVAIIDICGFFYSLFQLTSVLPCTATSY